MARYCTALQLFLLLALSVSNVYCVTCPGFPGYCSESFAGQTCVVVCSRGRNNVPLCQEDGTWTDIPRCIEHEPGVEQQIPGFCPGIAGYCSEGYVGQRCNFACSVGPHIDSSCTADGTWTPYPTCQDDVRETQDGCNPCPGPDGAPRNRPAEAAGAGLASKHPQVNANDRTRRPTFAGNQAFGVLPSTSDASSASQQQTPQARQPLAPPPPQPFVPPQARHSAVPAEVPSNPRARQPQQPQPQSSSFFNPQPQQSDPSVKTVFNPQTGQQERVASPQPQQPQPSIASDPRQGERPISEGRFVVGADGDVNAVQQQQQPRANEERLLIQNSLPSDVAKPKSLGHENRAGQNDLHVFEAIPGGSSAAAAADKGRGGGGSKQKPRQDSFGPFEVVDL